MAYTPTVWKNGEFPPIDAEHLNKIEQGIEDAVSVTPQTLSDEQKAQARGNIGAANKETQDKVFITAAPAKSITLAASELSAYINALPRLLTEIITITVTAGTAAQTLDLSNFYGSGRLRLVANGNVTLAGGVRSYYNRIMANLENFAITGGPSYEKSTVYAYDTAVLYLVNCTLTASDGIGYAIQASVNGAVAANGCSITGYYTAVQAATLSQVDLIDCTASGNTIGVNLYRGGIVLLCGTTPDTLGGSYNIKGGGIIVKANGTLL